MKGKILITDSLFIAKEHEETLTAAGYEIERLDMPEATEDQLVEAIKGKVGYILGGTETLTDKIIDAADALKAIAFTGIGYKGFIPNYEYVTKKGIAIANTPDGPTHAVAEWAVATTLAMNRNLFEISRTGTKKFLTTKGIEGQHVGIIGLGRIGSEITRMLKPFKPNSISYYSKSRYENSEKELDITYADIESVLKQSDIVFVCVSNDAGQNFITKKELALLKDDTLVVSFIHKGIINEAALLKELQSGRIRAVSDYPLDAKEANDLPLSRWYSGTGSNAFNTFFGIKLVSDMAVRSLLNLLETGTDENKVN
jgi:phosphoglycerate dehydrogenase-like enzyme